MLQQTSTQLVDENLSLETQPQHIRLNMVGIQIARTVPLPLGDFFWSGDLNSLPVPDPSGTPKLYTYPRTVRFDVRKQKNVVRREHN